MRSSLKVVLVGLMAGSLMAGLAIAGPKEGRAQKKQQCQVQCKAQCDKPCCQKKGAVKQACPKADKAKAIKGKEMRMMKHGQKPPKSMAEAGPRRHRKAMGINDAPRVRHRMMHQRGSAQAG